jgi:hypothetical protein
MNEKENPQYYQDIIAGMAERTIKRLVRCLCLLAVVSLALGLLLYLSHVKAANDLKANNEKWLEVWSQYDFESYEYQQDGKGVNIIGNMNGVDYDVPTSESEAPD